MPSVPTTGGPDVQSEALPTPFQQAPPAGAFPFAAGAATTELSGEIGKIATDERGITNRTMANDATNKYIVKSEDIVNEYRSLPGEAALEKHDAYVAKLDQLRQTFKGSLPSRHAQAEFADGTNSQFFRETVSMASHMTQQRQAVYARVDKDTISVGAKTFSQAAIEDQNLQHTDGVWDDLEKRVRQGVLDHTGLTGKAADEEVTARMSTVAHAALLGAAKAGSPNLSHLIERYGSYVDASAREQFENVSGEQSAQRAAASTFAGLPRVDLDGKGNVNGFVPETAVIAAKAALPATPQGDKARAMLDREARAAKESFDAAGAQLQSKVLRQGQGLGPRGQFGVPVGSPEWAELRALHSGLAEALIERATRLDVTAQTHADAALKRSSADARGTVSAQLSVMSQDALKALKPEDVMRMALERNPGIGGEDLARLSDKLKKLQGSGVDPVEKQFPQIAQRALRAMYKDHPEQAELNMGRATSVLEDLHAADPKLDAGALESAVASAFHKSGWFGKAPGESYQRQTRPAQAARPKPPNELELPDAKPSARTILKYQVNPATKERRAVYSDGTFEAVK